MSWEPVQAFCPHCGSNRTTALGMGFPEAFKGKCSAETCYSCKGRYRIDLRVGKDKRSQKFCKQCAISIADCLLAPNLIIVYGKELAETFKELKLGPT